MKRHIIYLSSLLILAPFYASAQDSTSGQSKQSKVLSLPNATVGYEYIAALPLASAEGEVKTKVIDGQLPPELKPEGIWVKGIPQSVGKFEFEIQAIDEIGQQSQQRFTVEVLRPPAKPLEIRHVLLPDCISFVAYDQPLLVEGGYPPYSWRILDGKLPNGLSFKDGRVVGIVREVISQPSKYEFSAEVKDSNQQITSQKFSLKLKPNSSINLEIVPVGRSRPELGKYVQLPESIVNKLYSITFAAIGGVPPLKWEITDGNLPYGIILDDNKLTGTPNSTGEFKFTLSVRDDVEQTSGQDCLLHVLPPPAPRLEILTKKLPDAYRTIPYEAALQAEGGNPPYLWEIKKGSLPDWAKLEKDSIIGIPKHISSVHQFTFNASIVDDAGTKAGPVAVSLEVKENPMVPPPLEIVSQELPIAYRLSPYHGSLLAQGGYPPYAWTVDKDTLPAWSKFNAGRITGLPKDTSAIGQAKIKVSVRDNTGNKAGPIAIPLEVKENLLIHPLRLESDEELPIAVVGVPYTVHLVVSGGRAPYRFDYKHGVEWLSSEPNGRIHGLPKIEGKQSLEVSVTDADGQCVQKNLTIAVVKFDEADLQVPDPFKIPAFVGKTFQFKLPIDGGISPYQFSISEPLPKWLKFESSTRCFSGIPDEVGNWPVKVEIIDALAKSSKIVIFELEVLPVVDESGWHRNKIALMVLVSSVILLVFYFVLVVTRAAFRKQFDKSGIDH